MPRKPCTVDWEAVRIDYVCNGLKLRELQEKYNVSMTVISRKSMADDWRSQKQKHVEKCFRKAEEKAANAEADRLDKLRRATELALDIAVTALEDNDQFKRYIVTEGCGMGESVASEKKFDKYDLKALKDLTSIIKDLTGLTRDFYGIPTQAQAEAQRIAAERLELERRKTDAAVGSDEDEDGTGVVLIPEVSSDG